jgi:hypothetical protein
MTSNICDGELLVLAAVPNPIAYVIVTSNTKGMISAWDAVVPVAISLKDAIRPHPNVQLQPFHCNPSKDVREPCLSKQLCQISVTQE